VTVGCSAHLEQDPLPSDHVLSAPPSAFLPQCV
jgi:hypothetical protein